MSSDDWCRVAELEAENGRLRDELAAEKRSCAVWSDWKREVSAEVERLKVCGTCDWWYVSMWAATPAGCEHLLSPDSLDEYGVIPGKGQEADAGRIDSCHFAPSRWKPYWESE